MIHSDRQLRGSSTFSTLRSLSCFPTPLSLHSSKQDSAGLDDSTPLALSQLPYEVLLYILSFVPPPSLSCLSLVSPLLRLLAQPLLYSQPCTTSLDQLELLIDALTRDRKDLSSEVRQLTIVGRVFKSKGYGIRIQRLLKMCERVSKLELVGIDDLRPKHLVSNKSALTHLSLLNSSFRPHSLVNPPNLVSFTSSLTHLTLSNLGLPPPSTHLSTLISLASKTLKYLAISSIRDVESLEFHKTFSILALECPNLSTLVLGFLTDEQVETLSLPLLSSTTSSSPTPSTSYPILSQLSNLRSLTFTLPLPTLPLLLSLPPSLQTLSIRPPYSRQTLSNPHITSHSKIALLRVLNPVPSPSSTNTRGTNTPLLEVEEGASVGSMMRRRTRSIPLELLEEEETILSFLSIALSPNPPPLPPTSILGKGIGLGSKGSSQVVPFLKEGESMLGETNLNEVRWECKGLRGGKERVREIMRMREGIKREKERK